MDFVRFAFGYAAQQREKKFILDGIWIYLYFDDPSVFEDYAVFIKGTSFLKSRIRTAKREMQRDRETLKDRKEMFGREARNYLLDEEKIDRYRSFYGRRPETVFRKETNEANRRMEAAIGELKDIDRCFVNEDADAIREILRRAEGNTEITEMSRLRIMNECQAALLELRL